MFEDALLGHISRRSAGQTRLGNQERRHVLCFYGIGGIGKTELSRRLERWAHGELGDTSEWGTPPRMDTDVRTTRVDFHGSSVTDAVEIILRLRAAVACPGHRFPAFDVGLAAWWSFARPGTPLPDLYDHRGFDLRGQISDTLNDVFNDAGASFGLGPLTVRMGIRLFEAVRAQRIRSRALRECAPLAAVVEQARHDPSPYVAATLAGLLSWDLERVPAEERPVVVAFADAFEYIQLDDRSQERVFNRIVHLTPDVLWVVTSRSSLDWASSQLTGLLPATGPRVWPGLQLDARDAADQHLVGDLSDTDVRRYLAASSGADGNPELGEGAMEAIRQGAHGLPLYLDLSLAIARTVSDGGPVETATFGGSLPQLVHRIFADLPASERELARTASLIPRFDPELLADTTDELVGDAQRLCRRTLVTRDAHPLFPFRLHDAVRSALAEESVTGSGAWAVADRTARAARLAEALRRRHEALLHDHDRRLDVLEAAAGLAARNDLRLPWLLTASMELPGLGHTSERLPAPGTDTWMGQVSGMFAAWRNGSLRERIDYLEQFISQPLPADIDKAARRRLAFAYRSAQRPEPALRLMRELLERDPESQLLRYQIPSTLRVMGDYAGMQQHLEQWPLSDPSAELRLRADLAYDLGDLIQAMAGTVARAAHLRTTGRLRVALENEVRALWMAALLGRADPAECEAAAAEADRYGVWLDLRSALAAKAISATGIEAARRGLTELRTVVMVSRGAAGWREYTTPVICALRWGDHRLLESTREEWLSSDRVWSPNYLVLDRLFGYAGFPRRFGSSYLPEDLEAEAERRWQAVFDALVNQA
ncbi:tetratricopeptide repeat protein [Streptomyces cynarae]|uniref:tetratricopeptide repeat protein n=1 Tax=Streptomyces cynarae TaxID=2981134 RepID=UPI00406CD1A8